MSCFEALLSKKRDNARANAGRDFWECVVRFGRIVAIDGKTVVVLCEGSVSESDGIGAGGTAKTATHLRECDVLRDLATSARQSHMYKPCSCNHSLGTSPRKRPRA